MKYPTEALQTYPILCYMHFDCSLLSPPRPIPAIEWTFPDTRTGMIRRSQSGARIRIQNIAANDVGVYTCIVVGTGSFDATLSLAGNEI